MTKRDILQHTWASEFLSIGKRGIMHLCPRAGKIRTSIHLFRIVEKLLGRNLKILISYPDKNIQKSWEEDLSEVGYNGDISYVTHVSLEKVVENKYDIIIIDEIHLLSTNQKSKLDRLSSNNSTKYLVGLTGTLSKKTKDELFVDCGLRVFCNYSLGEAINDKFISDYRIHIIKVDLDNKEIVNIKKNRTEKQQYNALTWVIENKGASLFLSLARMRVVQNSISKIKKTKDILEKLKDKRVLVFCPNNKTAKQLGCKLHTSKVNNQVAFEKFVKGKGNNHMAVCKIGNTGVSFKGLDNILICAFDSNSENLTQRICRSLILDEENKISNIYIVTSKEKVELGWLEKSLEFFDPKKIKYYE